MTLARTEAWWVTGAGSGIGNALAQRLAQIGHTVYASSRSESALLELSQRYANVIPLPVDVSDRAAMQRVFTVCKRPPTHLDGIILSAGICEYVDLPDLNTPAITAQMQINFLGAVHACEVALPLLEAAAVFSRPQLVGIGSLSSLIGFPRAEGYGASKAAMAYFLDSLRCDIQQRIQVTTVYPGFVKTRLTAANDFPMPFVWELDQAADHILERLWQERRVITFPWQLSLILRVAQLLPSLWYGYLIPRLSRQSNGASS